MIRCAIHRCFVSCLSNVHVYALCKVFLALLDCVSRANAVAQASVVRRSSVKCVFSETVKQINAKFCGKVAIHHISRPFFSVFKNFEFLNFNELFFIFVNMAPYGSENFKTLLLLQLRFFFNQTFSTYSLAYRNFEIQNLKFLKKDCNLP